jgi:hypothetical protein
VVQSFIIPDISSEITPGVVASILYMIVILLLLIIYLWLVRKYGKLIKDANTR